MHNLQKSFKIDILPDESNKNLEPRTSKTQDNSILDDVREIDDAIQINKTFKNKVVSKRSVPPKKISSYYVRYLFKIVKYIFLLFIY